MCNVDAVLSALFQLCSLRITSYKDKFTLNDVIDDIKSRSKLYTDWDRKGEPIEGVTQWLEMPPLPGDNQWGDSPFEITEELQLKPIKTESA